LSTDVQYVVMAPLDNVKHEMFAKAIVNNKGKVAESYRDVYDPKEDVTAVVNGSRLLGSANVRSRVVELMDKVGLDLPSLSSKMKEHVNANDGRLSLDATKFSYKLHGAVEDGIHFGSTHQHLHVNESQLEGMPSLSKLGKLRDLLR